MGQWDRSPPPPPGGGGGHFDDLYPDVCVEGLENDPFRRKRLVLKHTHNEGIFFIVHTHIYMGMYIYRHIYIYIYMDIFIYMRNVCMYVCMYVCIYIIYDDDFDLRIA